MIIWLAGIFKIMTEWYEFISYLPKPLIIEELGFNEAGIKSE